MRVCEVNRDKGSFWSQPLTSRAWITILSETSEFSHFSAIKIELSSWLNKSLFISHRRPALPARCRCCRCCHCCLRRCHCLAVSLWNFYRINFWLSLALKRSRLQTKSKSLLMNRKWGSAWWESNTVLDYWSGSTRYYYKGFHMTLHNSELLLLSELKRL